MEPSSSNAIMEKLYDKFSRKPWNETMKLVRSCMDKPHQATSTTTSNSPITSCLEKIERTLHARSLSTVVNKLESLSKEKGLSSCVSPSGTSFYITSDMFYIEIHLENDGTVKDVKVACPAKSFLTSKDLLQCLRMQNYDAFGKILEELLNLYQIPGDSSTKDKGHVALHTLEKDICSLSVLHRTPTMDRVTEILCGKVGYIRPRTEGIPLSIEFYLSPYQILEELHIPGLEISGMKVFLTMGQADETHTIPLSPLIADFACGADVNPNFLPLTEVACMDLLACFFLTFHQPFPMSLSSIHELQKLTGIPVAGLKPAPLHELIFPLALSEKCKDDPTMSNYFFVSLPDCPKMSYFIDASTENSGAMVSNLPFAHCKCVPDIIEILRQQAAYNTLVSSCTSVHTSCEDSSDLLYFEVTLQKGSSLSVTFQHPLQDNLACVVIDVLSSRDVRCTLRTISEDAALNCSNDFLTRVINRCMSIPILMRAIFKRAAPPKVTEAIQSTEETSEQNPNENEESKAAPSWLSLLSSGDDSASVSPEGSVPETSEQASQCSSMEEHALVEPSGYGMEERASPESLGDGVGESASVGLSSAGTEESASPESSGDGMGESASGLSSAGMEESASLESPGDGMGESASVGLSSAGMEESASPESPGDGMGESASVGLSSAGMEESASPESPGDGMGESASVGLSSTGMERNAFLELPADNIRDHLFLAILQLTDDESTLSDNFPENRMEDYCTDSLPFSPDSI